MDRLRAILATMRVANLPSVVSNVWLGIALAFSQWGFWAYADPHTSESQPFPGLVSLLAASLCAYLCGSFLNDWHDQRWDAIHRPERALPAGLVSARAYLFTAVALAIACLVLAFDAGPRTVPAFLSILICAGLYTRTHKQNPAAVLAVPSCRALLVIAGYLWARPRLFEVIWQDYDDGFRASLEGLWYCCKTVSVPLTHTLGVFCYVLGLSLFARHEATGNPSHGMAVVARALLWLPLAAMSAWWIPYYPLAGAAALIPFAAWTTLSLTIFRRPLPRLVSALLAGMPLVDFIALLPLATALALPDQSVFASPFLATTLLLPLAAFALALLLQRLAPAT